MHNRIGSHGEFTLSIEVPISKQLISCGMNSVTGHNYSNKIFSSCIGVAYGNTTAPYCIGGEGSNSQDGFDTPLVDCACTRGVAALANHKPEAEANARYVFDEDRNVHTIAAIKETYLGDEIFCDYGDKYQLQGDLVGSHDTLEEHSPPPKWYK